MRLWRGIFCGALMLLAQGAAAETARINTGGWVDSPFISRDGQRLYFTYMRWNLFKAMTEDNGKAELLGPDRPGLNKVESPEKALLEGDIYVATRKPDGSFGAPQPLPFNKPGLDNGGMEAGSGFYFAHTGEDGQSDLYVARKDAAGRWGPATALPGAINSPAQELSPHVAPTEEALWFTSDRAGGYGGKDIYFSQKINGAWSTPVNLGPEINTAGDEDQIWVDPKGSGAIYYNSGMQLMRTQWQDKTFMPPQPVRLLGDDPAIEVSFTDDGKEGFFTMVDIVSKRLIIMRMVKQPDGSWGDFTPVD